MKTQEERKRQSEQKIQAKGIAVNLNLPMIESASMVQLRDTDDICKRAIAALLSIQIAFEIQNQSYENVKYFIDLMEQFDVRASLNQKEQNLVNGTFSQQDIVNVVWEYECYWSLVWALGLVEEIEDAGEICDCDKAIQLVSGCGSYEEFKSQCKLRDIDEILDMLDLYYRYHWAVVEKRVFNPELPTGTLNEEVVFERRRGLEWLVSEQNDWHEISLDT